MVGALAGEGIRDVQAMAVTHGDVGWENRADGFNSVTFPVLRDNAQVHVWDAYGADYYELYLVDKKGRLVTKEADFTASSVTRVNGRVRQLYAE